MGENLNKLVVLFYSLFAISLPFNGNEIDIIGVSRFEIKITMITFILLFLVWLLVKKHYNIKYIQYEYTIYSLAFIYVCAQYISVLNSKSPFESFVQSIVITSLVFMMLVSSQMIIDKKTAHYVVISMAITAIVLSIVFVVNYYSVNFYYFSDSGRLGYNIKLFGQTFRGDPPYVGDIFLYGLGPLFYGIFHYCRDKLSTIVSIPIQIIYFSALTITYTKGVIFSAFIFFIISICILKNKRNIMTLSCILYIFVIFGNVSLKHINTMFIINEKNTTVNSEEIVNMNQQNLENNTDPVNIITESKKVLAIDKFIESVSRDRLNILYGIGKSSYNVREKAIKVSLINSLSNIWFGNGAGISQALLPKMADEYDKKMRKESQQYDAGYSNITVIDSHNLFITELFNVGVVGSLSLLLLCFFIFFAQLRVIINNRNTNNVMNELLFATGLCLLAHRMTDSFVVIPFLWFILGLSFGVSKLQISSHQR